MTDDELLAAMQAQLDAEADRWYSQEDDDTWQLFRGMYQIIKAPKHGTDYAEYWPSPAESAQIVTALNTLAAVTAERDALRAALTALVADEGAGVDRDGSCTYCETNMGLAGLLFKAHAAGCPITEGRALLP